MSVTISIFKKRQIKELSHEDLYKSTGVDDKQSSIHFRNNAVIQKEQIINIDAVFIRNEYK